MKTVFSSHSEVCHVYASRSQEIGRAGNISFNKDVILSYHWWPMAKFINDNTILLVNWSYSNSTSKHLNRLHRAIPDYYKKVYVRQPCERYNYDNIPHEVNIQDFISRIKTDFDKFPRSNKYKSYILTNQQSIILNLIEYCNLFNLALPDYKDLNLNSDKYYAEIVKQEERLKVLEATKEERRQKKIAAVKDDIIKLENLWMVGETNKTNLYIERYVNATFSKTRLRVKDDRIETSLGANVSLREARILYDMIQRKDSVKGHKIGSYTVIGLNGTLKIGCHEIERDEINRIATLLNW
jgi:hypothetical protein